MKTTKKLFNCVLIIFSMSLLTTSCQKEEILASQSVISAKNASIRMVRNPIQISIELKKTPYGILEPNSTTYFKGQMWCVTSKKTGLYDDDEIPISESMVWSSKNGVNWFKRSHNPFEARTDHSLISYDGKMWLIGGFSLNDRLAETSLEVWNTSNGTDWTLVADPYNSTGTPFERLSKNGAVVFNNKMLVFFADYNGKQKIYSSTNGTEWTLETNDHLPSLTHGRAVVFHNTLYFIGGKTLSGDGPSTLSSKIWKSTNGQNWQIVNRGLRLYPDHSIFSGRILHSASVYDNKVWVIAGEANGILNNEIWVTKDMKNWFKYNGPTSIKKMSGHTTIDFKNKLWILEGGGTTRLSPYPTSSKPIWSIESSSGLF